MNGEGTGRWLLCWITLVAIVAREEIRGEENVADALRSLREQVNALLDHRQEDYNALEGSLKRAIEKNTELFVLKNEMKQLRKEVISLRGGNGNGNEAKNERLRVRWLGSAVTELRGEVAEVLRTRNASEELAERSRMKGEFTLLKGDVSAVGRGIRNLGGRIAKIEAALGTIRVDVAAVKERFTLLSRSCADVASQLSSVQIEFKSLRCESPSAVATTSMLHQGTEEGGDVGMDSNKSMEHGTSRCGEGGGGREGGGAAGEEGRAAGEGTGSKRHGYYARRNEGHRSRLEDRLKSLERKISLSTQRRASLKKRIAAAAAYENESEEWANLNRRVSKLERAEAELSRQMSNVNESIALTRKIEESRNSRMIGSLRALEEAIETNNSSIKREILRLNVNAVRKAAELSLTREELNNLRRTVQALSVSASKLQERSDQQQEAIDLFNATTTTYYALPNDFHQVSYPDRDHFIGNNITGDCEEPAEDGLKLLEANQRPARPILIFCRQGWTVIARRIDGTLDFDRSWNDYSIGFGSPVSEYWIGNQFLHKLTRDNCSRLRVDMVDIYGERWRAQYDWFTVESEENGYKLRIGGYSGNATDALSYQNGMAFSAKDRDMDVSMIHCARNYHGGWWFSRCQHANLNGKYSFGLTWFRSDTNRWMSIASSEMSVRTRLDCRS